MTDPLPHSVAPRGQDGQGTHSRGYGSGVTENANALRGGSSCSDAGHNTSPREPLPTTYADLVKGDNLADFFDAIAERLRADGDRYAPELRWFYQEIADDYEGRAIVLRRTQSARALRDGLSDLGLMK